MTSIAVLMVGYGVWLKYIVSQQLKSKDTAIEALEAIIKSKEAEVSALKSDTAPAVAKAYVDMRQYADHVTLESQRLSQQVHILIKQKEYSNQLAVADKLLNQSEGLIVATNLMEAHLGALLFPSPPKPPDISADSLKAIIEAFMKTYRQTNQEINRRTEKGKEIIESAAKTIA
jgi:hypothetical protein